MHYLVMALYSGEGELLPSREASSPAAGDRWERIAIFSAPGDEHGPSSEQLSEALVDSSLPDSFEGELLIVPLDRAKTVRVKAQPSVDVRSWGSNPF